MSNVLDTRRIRQMILEASPLIQQAKHRSVGANPRIYNEVQFDIGIARPHIAKPVVKTHDFTVPLEVIEQPPDSVLKSTCRIVAGRYSQQVIKTILNEPVIPLYESNLAEIVNVNRIYCADFNVEVSRRVVILEDEYILSFTLSGFWYLESASVQAGGSDE